MTLGLLANMRRIRAIRILDQAKAIGVVMNPTADKQLLRDSGMTDGEIARMEVEKWKADGIDRAAGKIGSM